MIDAGLWLVGDRSIIDGRPSDDTAGAGYDCRRARVAAIRDETILTRHLAAFGVEVERGVTLTGLNQNDENVTTQLARADGEPEEAAFAYVIGCDGAHSAVRRALGIAFEGDAFPMNCARRRAYRLGPRPRHDVRALQLDRRGAPDVFIAIPLPERALPGRRARASRSFPNRAPRPRHPVRRAGRRFLRHPGGGRSAGPRPPECVRPALVVDLPHQHAAGRSLSRRPPVHRRRRRAHPSPDGRARHEYRHPGCLQPCLEAGAGGQGRGRRRRYSTATTSNAGRSASKWWPAPARQPRAMAASPPAARIISPTRRSGYPFVARTGFATTPKTPTPPRAPATGLPTPAAGASGLRLPVAPVRSPARHRACPGRPSTRHQCIRRPRGPGCVGAG